ncbi:MAG: SgcJ/EcaC family oxidoreductase [Desulfovibrionaceae bacterium]|nr:SgcJ/EcaC family oxidoreductase [Desulfovibrionaceae bacterium]MBF0513273.1 SgcJ/EcaC family oxidoreductase [Desulfovibrionaceae bacterium]
MTPRTREKIYFSLAWLLVLLAAPVAWAGPADDVRDAAAAWVAAFNSHDPDAILALYDPEAVFWGTTSPVLRAAPEAIREYFQGLPGRPMVKITLGDAVARVSGDIGICAGSYTVSDERDGRPVVAPARFSFTFRKRDGKWLILDHHSSVQPKAPQ